jgi:phosphonoacetaldehyde dehydrogenase
VAQGARLLTGNLRRGALYSPTVLDRVARDDGWCARRPSARSRRSSASTTSTRRSHRQRHGLRPVVGGLHQPLDYITRFVNELNVGTVNVREVPGYRLELTPFGGIKDSGLGYKEGVQEAMKSFTNTKTYSLPW